MIKLNIYTVPFVSVCPRNAVPVFYILRLETEAVHLVEDLLKETANLPSALHETLAEILFGAFGGKQTIVAEHHGVKIETVRCDRFSA